MGTLCASCIGGREKKKKLSKKDATFLSHFVICYMLNITHSVQTNVMHFFFSRLILVLSNLNRFPIGVIIRDLAAE